MIGRITPGGIVSEFSTGIDPNAHPLKITAGADGNLWFTERTTGKVGRITTVGAVTEFVVGNVQFGPDAITAGPDGNIWFTEGAGNRICRLTTAGVLTEFRMGISSGAGPSGIATGSDGNLWFTEGTVSQVGRITPLGVVTEYSVSVNSGPEGIVGGPDGNLWFTEAHAIGRITTKPPTVPPTVRDETYEIELNGGKLNVFSRVANGNVAPLRSVTSATLDGPVALAVDDVHDEVFVANQDGHSIDVYPRNAIGISVPRRHIFGALTGLGGPRGVAIDPVANEIFVSDLGVPPAIRVLTRTANGNVAPLRTISGVDTGLVAPSILRIDRLNGEICVIADASPGTGVLAYYPIQATGAQAPIRTILTGATHSLAIDSLHDEVFISQPPVIRVYRRSTGALIRTVAGASTKINPACNLLALSVDTQNDELVATTCGNRDQAAVLVFARGADGDVPPLRTLLGGLTNLASPTDVAVTKTEVLPFQLLVDQTPPGASSNGNGVLEPGETVTLEPTWINWTPAPVALTSMLSDFAGPAGATYQIVSSVADYGTIPVEQSCHFGPQCPVVSLSVPASRPVQHWDASILETPSTANLLQRWHIHIGGSFGDVPASAGIYRFVETIFHNGVTGGCGGTSYCPSDLATRAQMAVFLLISREGASYVPPPATGALFGDVPASNGFAKWIEELANRGVTAGCGSGNYCPNASVTRAQMAVFLLVTKEGTSYTPPPATGVFADVPVSSGFAKWIEELARRGVTAGCGNGNFCPNATVTRGQMAVFLTTTFSLALNGL